MHSGRKITKRRKKSPKVPAFERGGAGWGGWPGARWACGILAALALVLLPAGAGTRAVAAEGPNTAGTSKVSDAQLLSTLASGPDSQQGPAAAGANNSTSAPLTLTLQDALERAEKYSPQFQSAVTATKMARAGVTQARSTLLPSVDYTMQELADSGQRHRAQRAVCDQ